MKLSQHQQIFSKHIARLIRHAELLGIDLTFGEADRTLFQQKEYVRLKKSRTMHSNHLRRLAVDFNFFINGKLFYKHELITKALIHLTVGVAILNHLQTIRILKEMPK